MEGAAAIHIELGVLMAMDLGDAVEGVVTRIEQGLYVAMGRVGGEGQRGKQRMDAGVAQGVVQDQRRVRRRQPRHLLTGSVGARRADSNRDGQCGGEALGWRARRRGRSNGERRELGHPPAVRRARERLCGAGGGDDVLDSVGFEPIGETTAKEKTKSRRKNEPDLAALARRASGSAGEAAGRRLGAGKWRGSFLERAESRAPADAQPNTRADARNAKLLKMPTLFPKLLETKFFYFAKFSRMLTSFSKLLEILLASVAVANFGFGFCLSSLTLVKRSLSN